MMEFRVLKNRVEYKPRVWFVIAGRKVFDRSIAPMIRQSWKLGDYTQ